MLGLLSIEYAAELDFRASFVAMALAMAIDSSDGALARAVKIRQRVPRFDGALLDNVVDYLTYVVAPAFLMIRAGLLLPGHAGLVVGSAVMLASAYGFCRIDAKTDDHYFLGFPSYWNLVAFYLFCLRFPLIVNTLIVAGFAAMVFVPIKYIYPSRTVPLRPLTVTPRNHLGSRDDRDAPDAAGGESDPALRFVQLYHLLLSGFVLPARTRGLGARTRSALMDGESVREFTASDPAPWLEVIDRSSPILLIAPHGGRAETAFRGPNPKVNDLHTAEITRTLADRFGASALVNFAMDRNRLDCNRMGQVAERAPWLLEIIAGRVEEMVASHGRAIVLLIHGWNIIEPRVDFGLGARLRKGRLVPAGHGHISAGDEFINRTVVAIAERLRAGGIAPDFGVRYPAGGFHNLLQVFTARHLESPLPALRRLATIAATGAIDAVQLELSVAVRMPGSMRDCALDAISAAFPIDAAQARDGAPTIEVRSRSGPNVPPSKRRRPRLSKRQEPAFRRGPGSSSSTRRRESARWPASTSVRPRWARGS